VLSTSGPFETAQDEENGGTVFRIQIVRKSLKQPFGLGLCSEGHSSIASERSSKTGAPSGLGSLNPTSSTTAARTTSAGSGDDTISFEREDSLSNKSSVRDPELGSNTEDFTPSAIATPVPVVVKENLPHYGLEEGDRLVSVNGQPAHSMDACQAMMRHAAKVSLEFRRLRSDMPRLGKHLHLADLDNEVFDANFGFTPRGLLNFFQSHLPRMWFAPILCCNGESVRAEQDGTLDFVQMQTSLTVEGGDV